MSNDPEEALLGIVRILKPMTSGERHRAVNAAMTYLGETFLPTKNLGTGGGGRVHADDAAGGGVDLGGYPKAVSAWMKQFNISPEELDPVVQFHEDGTFAIHDVPGKTKKEKSLNVYTLTGVCTFLTSNVRTFQDSVAREHCSIIGCLDKANHAAILNDHGPEFSGDKSKGYSISNIAMKKAAALVKEMAGTK